MKYEESPLMWEWHRKKYLGGAHGVSGILYTLLEVPQVLEDERAMGDIRTTVDFLLNQRTPTGNLLSSIGSERDALVQWCHGSVGFVPLLCKAFRIWNDQRYWNAAIDGGEVIWERGLIRKGPGLCHGVEGNAYPFLSLFKLTGDARYYGMAFKFFTFAKKFSKETDWTLFEGVASHLTLAVSLLSPSLSTFPGFDVDHKC